MTSYSAGKLWGMRRLADGRGHFRMVATDQRPPIMALIRTRIARAATWAEIGAVKRMLIEALSEDASAILTDPVWGYPAAADVLRVDRGLMVTLEDHEYDQTRGGRRSRVIAGWKACTIRSLGADAVKLLAWVRPDADAAVMEHQRQFVAEVGRQCQAADIPFVLELLVYPFGVGGGPEYTTDPDKRPELVLESVRAFTGPDFGIDLWKLEAPLPAALVPDPDGPEAASVQPLFDRLGRLVPGPWVVLSGGAEPERFRRILTYACRAGASGFLAGRSIWADALAGYPDQETMTAALKTGARSELGVLNEITARLAAAWSPPGPARLPDAAGPEFARAYGARAGKSLPDA